MHNASEICTYLDKDIVNIINIFKEDKKLIKGYKIIGNKWDTTLIIKFIESELDTGDCTQPMPAKHKSPSARTRDYNRSINRSSMQGDQSIPSTSISPSNMVNNSNQTCQIKQDTIENADISKQTLHNKTNMIQSDEISHASRTNMKNMNNPESKPNLKSSRSEQCTPQPEMLTTTQENRNIDDQNKIFLYQKMVEYIEGGDRHVLAVNGDRMIDYDIQNFSMAEIRSSDNNFYKMKLMIDNKKDFRSQIDIHRKAKLNKIICHIENENNKV